MSLERNDEIWKPILGYEGYYEVSNLGRIKSLARKVHNPHGNGSVVERIMAQHIDMVIPKLD